MIIHLTEEEAEYLRDRPFWDWKSAEIDHESIILAENKKVHYDIQSIIRKENFYHNLYKKLGGKEGEHER